MYHDHNERAKPKSQNMTKYKISTTEFVNEAIPCLFMPKRDYNGAPKEFDLTTPHGRGKYYHAYIAKHFNPDNEDYAKINFYNETLNRAAEAAIEWTNEVLPDEAEIHSEELLSMDIPGVKFTLTAQPDIYSFTNNTLYIIDFKYSNYTSNLKNERQIKIYAGILYKQFNDPDIKVIKTYIKYLNKCVKREYRKEEITSIFKDQIEDIKSYIRNTGYTPGIHCMNCPKLKCSHNIKLRIERITHIIEEWEMTADDPDVIDDDTMRSISPDLMVLHREAENIDLPNEKEEWFNPNDEQMEILVEIAKENGYPIKYGKDSVTSPIAKKMFKDSIVDPEFYETCFSKRNKTRKETSKQYY